MVLELRRVILVFVEQLRVVLEVSVSIQPLELLTRKAFIKRGEIIVYILVKLELIITQFVGD